MIPKFRAWFITNKVMIQQMTLTQAIHQKENQFSLARLEDEFIFMMSTWLLDNNGVEIFDGDIVKQFKFHPIAEPPYELIGVVKMLEGQWVIDTGEWCVPLWSELNENEVIGDMYRNKELLEVIK